MSTETPWPTPLPSPHDQTPQQPSRIAVRADLGACAVLTAAGLLLAFAVGALWRATAPAVLGVVNQGAAYYAAPEGKTFVGRDGWYALFACIAAVLLALFAFLRYRANGSVGAAIGLAGGGIAGGYLAAWFGGFVGPGRGSITRAVHGVANGATFNLPVSVRATGVIWLWPAVAAGLYFFLLLLFGPIEPELELELEPEQEQQAFRAWGEQPEQGGTEHGIGEHGIAGPSVNGSSNGISGINGVVGPMNGMSGGAGGAADNGSSGGPTEQPPTPPTSVS
jgi:hypothetical protein